MAGPYNSVMKFSNGEVLNIYQAANVAVGTELPVNKNGAAVVGSQVYFKFKENVDLIDFYSANTAGQFEIVADDDPTGKMLVTDAAVASTNNGRVTPRLTFRGGVQYKLLERVAGAA